MSKTKTKDNEENYSTLISAVLVSMIAMSFVSKSETAAESEVKELVLNAYVNGAFNGLDAVAMRKGFRMKTLPFIRLEENRISKYPIAVWADGVVKRKGNNYDANDPKNKWTATFAMVDVTGHAAQVKIELFNQGKHVYTDYLSLLRFESGWRIVAKVYQAKYQNNSICSGSNLKTFYAEE